MTTERDLALKEYEISKDNIKWVMGHLITLSGSFIAVSAIVFQLLFDGEPETNEQTATLIGVIIILLNMVFAFLCYQNVQIIALQRHIQSLEVRLGHAEVFRWESRIARIWYGANARTLMLNFLIVCPALGLMITVYASLGKVLEYAMWFWLLPLFNILYFTALGYCISKIAKRIEAEIPIDCKSAPRTS